MAPLVVSLSKHKQSFTENNTNEMAKEKHKVIIKVISVRNPESSQQVCCFVASSESNQSYRSGKSQSSWIFVPKRLMKIRQIERSESFTKKM